MRVLRCANVQSGSGLPPINLRCECALRLLCQRRKTLRVVHGDVRQHLAIEGDAGLQQAVDKSAVTHAVDAGRRIDAGDPQRTEIALLLLAANVGVLQRPGDRLLGDAEDLAAGVVVALGSLQDFLVTGSCRNTTLNSCHFSSPHKYGSMRSRRPASSARTWFVCRRLRFRLVAFLVRMWLLLAWPALYLPEAVFRKRLAAARLVLILGIAMSFRISVTGLGGLFAPRGCAAKRKTRFPSCPCRLVSR